MTYNDCLSIERDKAKRAIDSGKFLSGEYTPEQITSDLLSLVIDAFMMPYEELMADKQSNSEE